MNHPHAQPIDVEEQRRWLLDQHKGSNLSWSDLGRRMGVPTSTLSLFATGKYAGRNENVAEKIFLYRQTLAQQASLATEAPEVPGYFETETSRQLTQLLVWAQRGRIVTAAMGPGTGKTTTARQFDACFSNVFMATMTPSTAGVNNMQQEVLEALGEPDAVGTPQKLSKRIKARVKDLQNPLIIIDEAQHLSIKAVEEIRSWHDATGVGIALFGNEQVEQRMEGGSRKAAYAQLFSRRSLKIVRPVPLAADADALAEAWGIVDDATQALVRRIALLPGGLRNATMTLELASMIAFGNQRELDQRDIQDAWAQLSGRTVSA